MDDLTNTTLLNRYRLVKKKGSGQIADLYQGYDNKRDSDVAVKVLRRDRAQYSHFARSFTDEAHHQSQLNHPNIVRLYDFYQNHDPIFIVFDWVEGYSLREKIDQAGKPLPLSEAREVIDPVCKALNYAHNMKIVHCDVKPANILIEKSGGRVLITDFGIARYSFEANTGGTPPYMAPEQFSGRSISPRTDVYGLGVTLYEMLSGGRVPFRGDTPNSQGNTIREKIYWEVTHLSLPDLRQYNRQVTQSVEEMVRKSIAREASQRFPSTIAFLEGYNRALLGSTFIPDPPQPGGKVEEAMPPIPPELQRIPVKRKLPFGFRGAYLECISGGLAGYLLLLQKPQISIGRNSEQMLRLADRSVSRVHATIFWTRQGYCIQDDRSKAGTIVNEHAVSRPCLLQPGDMIQLGLHDRFIFRIKY